MKFLVCSRLSEHRYKTPEGYLVCVDSILSRTGKQTYSRDELFKDGCTDEVEVERSAEEVFSEKTLASFENKPLTIEHPEEDVTPANHNKYSVGFIRDIKRGKDGSEDVMLGTIVVTDAEAIELIETGKLKELSCGYDCDIEDEDNPQQRNIRGNHVALCEKGRAGIARIVDSVKDKQSSRLGEKVRFRNRVYVIIKVQKGKSDDVARLTLRPLERFDEKDKPFEGGGDSYWDIHIERWQLDDSCKDFIKDAMFEICYIDNGDVCIAIEAKDENDARQKFRRRYGMYYIKHIRKVKDGVKDMKVSHDNIREQPVFVMQSDVDKNLFFYIGKTHAMKEGAYTYAQYDMEGMTPDELRKELEANGWHKVARGPAPFIDEDPYKESTEGLEEAEKNLHDEMICNTETDCKDFGDSIKDGMKEEWDPYGMTDEEWVQSLDNAYARHKVKEVDITYKKSDLKFFHEDAAKAMSMFKRLAATIRAKSDEYAVSNVDTSGPIWSIKLRLKDAHAKDASDNAYRKVQTILSKNPQFKGKINKDEFDTGEIMIDFADYRNADKFVVECRRIGLKCREGYFGPDTTILVRDAATNDAKNAYKVSYSKTINGRKMYLSFVIEASSSSAAKRLAIQKGAEQIIDVAQMDYERAKAIGFDSVKDAKTEYIFNYRDTYHGTRDKMRVDANNLDEAIRKFGDTMALGGFGTANIYVVSVSPNDGYMRAYGKLSEMLKQKWTRDSVKDATYKVEYISSGAEMYPIVEVDAASESEAIETVRKKDKKFVRLISVKKKDSVKKLDSKKLLSIVRAAKSAKK